jgi:hypothetical protein
MCAGPQGVGDVKDRSQAALADIVNPTSKPLPSFDQPNSLSYHKIAYALRSPHQLMMKGNVSTDPMRGLQCLDSVFVSRFQITLSVNAAFSQPDVRDHGTSRDIFNSDLGARANSSQPVTGFNNECRQHNTTCNLISKKVALFFLRP